MNSFFFERERPVDTPSVYSFFDGENKLVV
jgi:hypothetical protein